MRILLATLFLSQGALADCPPALDHKSEISALFDKARAAANDMAGRAVSQEMWKLWLIAPDEASQALLDEGMSRRQVFDFLGAKSSFDRLVEYCPEYAEGYNQRAFVHFLSQEYDEALVDLDHALKLNPTHVGAQSGRALTLMEMGRLAEAREQLLAALENNPWLSERFLLSAGGRLADPAEDI